MVKCSTGPGTALLRTPARNLDIADIGIVGVLGTEAEIPHHLGRDLRIVRIEQGKRLPGDVVLQLALIVEAHLRRIFFGRRFVGRWPFQPLGRNDLHPHPLPDQVKVSRADEIGDHRCVVGSDEVAGLDRCSIHDAHRRENHENAEILHPSLLLRDWRRDPMRSLAIEASQRLADEYGMIRGGGRGSANRARCHRVPRRAADAPRSRIRSSETARGSARCARR